LFRLRLIDKRFNNFMAVPGLDPGIDASSARRWLADEAAAQKTTMAELPPKNRPLFPATV
jgi:hypothetical protein